MPHLADKRIVFFLIVYFFIANGMPNQSWPNSCPNIIYYQLFTPYLRGMPDLIQLGMYGLNTTTCGKAGKLKKRSLDRIGRDYR
jgi:hypothetical protein